MHKHQTSRHMSVKWLILACLVVVVVGVIGWLAIQPSSYQIPTSLSSTSPSTTRTTPPTVFSSQPRPGTPSSAVTNISPAVVSSPPPAPILPVPATLPVAAPPIHLSFPAVGIDVGTRPMDGTPHELEPPEDGFSYWLNNYGQAGQGATDTVYIIGHSCYGPDCTADAFPFNHLSSGVAVNQVITLTTANGDVSYRVTAVFTVDKDSTSAQKRGTWDNISGRLVLISCFTQDPLGKNIVVFATLIEK